MSGEKISEREQLALKIADYIAEAGLDTGPISGFEGQDDSRKGKPYVVLVSVNRYLDGVIYVYGPKFINFQYQTSFHNLPPKGSEIFKSFGEFQTFIENKLGFCKSKM